MKLATTILLLTAMNAWGQWDYLGQQGTIVQMTADSDGFRSQNVTGPTPASGYVYTIYSTSDDWQSNQSIKSGGGTDYGCCLVNHMYFLNSQVGIIAQKYQSFISYAYTSDGGQNWSWFSGTYGLQDVVLTEPSFGYFANNTFEGAVFNKWDANQTIQTNVWDSLEYTNCRMAFLNTDSGFVALENATGVNYLYKTMDGGLNWDASINGIYSQIRAISYPEENVVYIGTAAGEVQKSVDGGVTWNPVVSPNQGEITAMDFIDQLTGYIGCSNGEVFKTLDGGVSWSAEFPATSSSIIRMQIVDGTAAYCVTSAGELFKRKFYFDLLEPVIGYTIVPNPAFEGIDIHVIGGYPLGAVIIYDVFGKVVSRSNSYNVDVSFLRTGIYFLSVELGGSVVTKTFLKM